MSTDVDRARESLDDRLGEPERLTFPADWEHSGSWKRAQRSPAACGPVNPAEYDLLLGYPERDELGDRHRVLFAIYGGQVRAECDCAAYTHRGWCAHVAYLWWRWVRGRLGVVDLDTARTHLYPPAWLSVDDRTTGSAASGRQAATDGGVRR